jgi:hypothetical protein
LEKIQKLFFAILLNFFKEKVFLEINNFVIFVIFQFYKIVTLI